MPISSHPQQGSIIAANFDPGFIKPEMVKLRLVVVLSPRIKSRYGLCTVVALSTTVPDPVMPYHRELEIPFRLPKKWGIKCWIKGDMVNTVGFHRLNLLGLGKDKQGKRMYQTDILPPDMLAVVRRCVLHGMGLSTLTKHL
jgi:uncharacterized protein YifN (PemK superfamily)